ncbi:putative isochorismate synthase [Anaerococcus hydrogenalis]|nr:putative isochorismate synthase [Anaerococcus hydrogenalis]
MFDMSLLNNKNNLVFYFSTSEYELLAENIYKKILFSNFKDATQKIKMMIDNEELKDKIIVGAFPFSDNENGNFYVVDKFKKSEKKLSDRERVITLLEHKNKVLYKKTFPSDDVFKNNVNKGLNYISSGLIEKIVLSRGYIIEFENKIKIDQIIKRLYKNNALGYIYAINLLDNGFVLGASPEMLVSKRGYKISSNPLAGSRPRSNNLYKDKLLAEELKHSKKDLNEHKIVVNYIIKNLNEVCTNIKYHKLPKLINTNQLWHLSTHIEANVRDEIKTVFDVAEQIHPTPAVCGFPKLESSEKISELEQYNRGLFAGLVGWCDENGDGDLAILIRGAKINGNKIKIQAGAGIVEGSVPSEELKETSVKMKTILESIGLEI